MRRFIVVAALLGLSACGGELLPEDSQAPEQVGAEALCTGAPVECFCKSFKTEATCRTASSTCVWYFGRCSPAYE
jgi:hypothetical protein